MTGTSLPDLEPLGRMLDEVDRLQREKDREVAGRLDAMMRAWFLARTDECPCVVEDAVARSNDG
jgi:hypothetical protein